MRGADSHRRLRAFAWARLGVAALLLTLVPAMPAELVPPASRGLLALLLVVVVASSAALITFIPAARSPRLTWLIFLLDVVLTTAVVTATGGARSIFTFLYVLSVTAACVLLSRQGALVLAGVSSALYTALVFGRTVFPLAAFLDVPGEATALEVLTMFMNAGTLLVVAIVAGGLAERFRATHAQLETQRRDLRDLEAFKDLVFQSVTTGLIALDRRHVITAFNHAAEEITGLPVGQAIGRGWNEVFGDAVALAEIESAIERNARTAQRRELTLARADGTAVPLCATFSALRAGDGTRVGLIGACEDLSAVRQMEARMRQADRLATLGRMAANIAHEIRNPLASLTGAIEALVGTGLPTETRDRLASIVVKESARLDEIIRDFLAYARPAPLARASVNVAEILDEVLVLLEHQAAPGTLKVVREFPTSLPWSVDPQQFRQAAWNLCLNAVQAMPAGGELRVGATASTELLEIRVADTGEGIGLDDLGQVFEPFFSTKAGGSGLGLALVHRVVQDHGGDIDVRSTPGLGTTFTLSLPARLG
ncbi:MAG: two-component system sensor histidine kinase NtrB [Candidatus Rokuibacteriota bacterium]